MGLNKFYAVRVGRNPGIYTTWAVAEAQVKGYPGARFIKNIGFMCRIKYSACDVCGWSVSGTMQLR